MVMDVGVQSDAGTYPTPSAPEVAQVAKWNEYGTRRMRARPWMSVGGRRAYEAIVRELRQGAGLGLTATLRRRVARVAVREIRKTIKAMDVWDTGRLWRKQKAKWHGRRR